MTDKEYGYSIARDLFVNMTLLDLHKYFGIPLTFRLSLNNISFEEAEEAVLKWRSSNDSEKAASERS